MNLFVDTSVWSLALRRDSPPEGSEVLRLRGALVGGTIYTTGLVLQELLQGFQGSRARNRIIDCFPCSHDLGKMGEVLDWDRLIWPGGYGINFPRPPGKRQPPGPVLRAVRESGGIPC